MISDTWITVIVPGSGHSDPISQSATRYFFEKRDIRRKQVEIAQAVFDQSLGMLLDGEVPKLVTESEWRRVAAQATEPARKEKVRLYSERRRAADTERKRRRAEEREAAKAKKAEAEARSESNGHVPDVTDQHDAAVEEELALALADGHDINDPAGDEEREA